MTAELAAKYLDAWIRVHGARPPHWSATILLPQIAEVAKAEPDLHCDIKERGPDAIGAVMRHVRTCYSNGLVNA